MRFGYVFLGLVTLTSLHTSSGVCDNGVEGVQKDDICCDLECGECGGGSCGQRPGGNMNCCTSRIRESGQMCSATSMAPCIIDDEVVPPEGPLCGNGLPGVEDNSVCCEAECGTCGGVGCSMRPGGEAACCSGTILAGGMMCTTTMAAPCIMHDDEATGPPMEGPEGVCSNGLPGVENNDICCEAQCGTCGGVGCGQRPGGQDSCCVGAIMASGMTCSTTMAAPCVMDEDEATEAPTEAPTEVPEGFCSNGVPGVENDGVCCEAQCGTCGGADCGQLPGGRSGCCTGRIQDSAIYCIETMEAPCIIVDNSDDS